MRTHQSDQMLTPESCLRTGLKLRAGSCIMKRYNIEGMRSVRGMYRVCKIDKERAGVLVGTGMGGLTVFSDGVPNLIEKGQRKITLFFVPYSITNMGSALLGIDLGFMGPNYSISTACATSNYCFYAAAHHIRRGKADLMLAGGTEAAILPIGLGGFVACRACLKGMMIHKLLADNGAKKEMDLLWVRGLESW